MRSRLAVCVYTFIFVALALALVAAPASAQPPSSEQFRVEGAIGFWMPSNGMTLASTGFGILGNTIDFKTDLGLTDQTFPEFHLVGRVSRSSKFRLQFIPISYAQKATLTRTLVFNGQAYTVGLPVSSSLDWKAWRFGYEYDFYTADRGFGGLLIDFKYTDVTATLTSPIRSDFVQARAPIPAVGGIFRVYPIPSTSITGEVSGFSLGWLGSSLVKNNSGHYVDVDFYGTYNFTDNLGVQGGFRSFDVGFATGIKDTNSTAQCPALVPADNAGCFNLKGIYLGFVARY